MCHEKHHTQKKQREKLVLQIARELKLVVTTASKLSRYNPLQKQKEIIAIRPVIQKIEKKIGSLKNKVLGKVVSLLTRLIVGGLRRTLKEWPISKLEGMRGSVMRKVHTLLKNGTHFVQHLIMSALIVKNQNLLQKTISFLCQKVEAITYRTSNHSVALATVGSGRNFNIYENSDLLK